jgi:hypothetical protein
MPARQPAIMRMVRALRVPCSPVLGIAAFSACGPESSRLTGRAAHSAPRARLASASSRAHPRRRRRRPAITGRTIIGVSMGSSGAGQLGFAATRAVRQRSACSACRSSTGPTCCATSSAGSSAASATRPRSSPTSPRQRQQPDQRRPSAALRRRVVKFTIPTGASSSPSPGLQPLVPLDRRGPRRRLRPGQAARVLPGSSRFAFGNADQLQPRVAVLTRRACRWTSGDRPDAERCADAARRSGNVRTKEYNPERHLSDVLAFCDTHFEQR